MQESANKGKYYLYNNHGSIQDVKKFLDDALNDNVNSAKLFDNIEQCLEFVANMKYPNYLHIQDLSIRYYGYDERIDRDVLIMLTDRFGDDDYLKHYGEPQFIQFIVQV